MTEKIKAIVHTKPNCPNCERTKHEMDVLGIKYEVRPLTPESITRFKAMGLRAAPVVESTEVIQGQSGKVIWGGYDHMLIESLV